jgi:putative inorganic carbon (hco3(-)) transporter
MADALKRELSKLRLTGQWPLWADSIQASTYPLDRVIDGAILVFLASAAVSITTAQAAMLLALTAWAAKLGLSSVHRQLSLPLLLPIAAFVLASVLASLTAVDPLRSLNDLRNVFLPAFFFLLVNHVQGVERGMTLGQVLIVMVTIMAVYGLGQSVLYGPTFRINGTLSIYMTFAGILMLITTLALALLLSTSRQRMRYWLVPCLLLLTAALAMTQTRGAWLGLGVGAALILGSRRKAWLLVLPIAALAVFLLAPSAVKDRMRSITDPEDVTALERLYMWGSGLRIMRDHPITGVGMNGVSQVYPTYKDPRALRERRGHLHNNVMQVTAERGLLGLACWLWIWVAFYRYAWHIYAGLAPGVGDAKALVVGSVAGVTAFHIAGLSEYTFGDSEVMMVVYFLMALPFLARRPDLIPESPPGPQ